MANTNITSELLDSLLAGRDPKTVFQQDGLLDELKKALDPEERKLVIAPTHRWLTA